MILNLHQKKALMKAKKGIPKTGISFLISK